MANVQVVKGDSLETSRIEVSNASGDTLLTVQEALDVSLALSMAVLNLNGMFWSSVPHAESSTIRAVAYQAATARLRVTFGGGSYLYHGVEQDVVKELSAAKSSGTFVQNTLVKHPERYPFLKEK